MALFEKRSQTSSSAPLYTVGLSKTVVIVGLGNPGQEYNGTRHNIGFTCLDNFTKNSEASPWIEKKDLRCLQATVTVNDTRVLLIKPTTYMNNSGESIQKVLHFYKVTPKDLVVIHDELDIPFGQLRTRVGGNSAGHNGVQSIINNIGEDFGRIRIGIHNDLSDQAEGKDFVLSRFDTSEEKQLPNLTREVSAMITEYLTTHDLPHDTRSFLV